MRQSLLILTTLLTLTISSCYKRTQYWTATAYKYNDTIFKYEIQLPYHQYTRGNVHNISFEKYESDESDWIYVNKLNGKVGADSMVFTDWQHGTMSPYKQSALKGEINFLSDTFLEISLQMPVYLNGNDVDHWEQWEYNGRYKLAIKKETAPFTEMYEPTDSYSDTSHLSKFIDSLVHVTTKK